MFAITIGFELVLSLMSFYIIWKTADLVTNLIYFFTGLSCLALALASINGLSPESQNVLMMEHHLIQAAILMRFMSIVQLTAKIRTHIHA